MEKKFLNKLVGKLAGNCEQKTNLSDALNNLADRTAALLGTKYGQYADFLEAARPGTPQLAPVYAAAQRPNYKVSANAPKYDA